VVPNVSQTITVRLFAAQDIEGFIPILEIAEEKQEAHVDKDGKGEEDEKRSVLQPEHSGVDEPSHAEAEVDPEEREEGEEQREACHDQDRSKENEADWDKEQDIYLQDLLKNLSLDAQVVSCQLCATKGISSSVFKFLVIEIEEPVFVSFIVRDQELPNLEFWSISITSGSGRIISALHERVKHVVDSVVFGAEGRYKWTLEDLRGAVIPIPAIARQGTVEIVRMAGGEELLCVVDRVLCDILTGWEVRECCDIVRETSRRTTSIFDFRGSAFVIIVFEIANEVIDMTHSDE
jgi:hypothetical protein